MRPGMAHGLPTRLHESYEWRSPRSQDWRALSDGGLSIRLTTGAECRVSASDGLDLEQSFEDQRGSNQMWLFALEPLRRVGELVRQGHDGHRAAYQAGWTSAADALEGPEGTDRWRRLPSMDHAAATRLRACLEAGEIVQDPELRRRIRRIANQTLTWVLDDANYRPNNHGLMSSIALLHWHVAIERPEGMETALRTALERIVALASSSFDAQGMCNENTIGYHNFNLHCYREILRLQEAEDISRSIDDDLRPILDRAQRALDLSVLQDGTVPTIGDSGRYRVAAAQSLDRPSAFPDSGLCLYKSPRLYVSLIGGARSEIHKHADDTGLTLYRDGIPLIVDCGSFLYDRTNPYRQSMESTLGHSVIVPEQFDGMLRQQFVAKYTEYRARVLGHQTEAGEWTMESAITLPDLVEISRSVTVLNDRWIVVKDSVQFGDGAVDTKIRQRWLFGPDIEPISVGGGSWMAMRDRHVDFTLHCFTAAETDVYHGEELDLHRGWYSEQYGQKSPITGLDRLRGGAIQVHHTLIDVGDRPSLTTDEIPRYVLMTLHS